MAVRPRAAGKGFRQPERPSRVITLVTLGVGDLGRSITFCRDLGLPLRERNPDDEIAFFTTPGAWLALYPRDRLAEDATVSAEGEGFAGVTLARTVDSAPAVDALLDDAEAAGATVVKPAREADWGGSSGYFADPDGHLWEGAYNPFLALE